MTINPKMWHDRHFVGLSVDAKLLWCFLLTGNNDGVPGLIRGGPGAYSDAMRWDRPTTASALDELIKATFIEYDQHAQLLRVPGAPKYSPCTNANVLKGWLRRWKDVPESPLKYHHIESLRQAAEDRPWFEEAWSVTFAPIKVPDHTKQVPLFLISPAKGSIASESEVLNPLANPLANASERVCETNNTYTDTTTDTYTDTDTSTPSRERPRVRDPMERHVFASELWRIQEELRSELAPNVVTRPPTGHDLIPIMQALEIYSREELENSLRVNAATAANKPEKLEYFNGYSNWHPNSLRRTVGQVVPTSSGRHSVRGRKKFKGGNVL